MKIGYVILDNAQEPEAKAVMEAERVYVDSTGRTENLLRALEYARVGDVIVTKDVHSFGEDAGEFIWWVLKINGLGLTLLCVNQNIDTSSREWQTVLSQLSRNGGYAVDNTLSGDDKESHFRQELHEYFRKVEAGEVTVKEVCARMGIGKSTYYRKWRAYKGEGGVTLQQGTLQRQQDKARRQKVQYGSPSVTAFAGSEQYHKQDLSLVQTADSA